MIERLTSTPNVIFSVTYYFDLQGAVSFFTIETIFYQVKLSMLYNVQITDLTFVGKICDV